MFDFPFKIGTLVILIAAGTVIAQPGFDRPGNNNVVSNIGDAVSNHGGSLLILVSIVLLAKPLLWGLKILTKSFLAGLGLRASGVFRSGDRDDMSH